MCTFFRKLASHTLAHALGTASDEDHLQKTINTQLISHETRPFTLPSTGNLFCLEKKLIMPMVKTVYLIKAASG